MTFHYKVDACRAFESFYPHCNECYFTSSRLSSTSSLLSSSSSSTNRVFPFFTVGSPSAFACAGRDQTEFYDLTTTPLISFLEPKPTVNKDLINFNNKFNVIEKKVPVLCKITGKIIQKGNERLLKAKHDIFIESKASHIRGETPGSQEKLFAFSLIVFFQ